MNSSRVSEVAVRWLVDRNERTEFIDSRDRFAPDLSLSGLAAPAAQIYERYEEGINSAVYEDLQAVRRGSATAWQ